MSSKGTERRVLIKDVEGRVNELESKLQDLREQMERIDERMQRIADTIIAASQQRPDQQA